MQRNLVIVIVVIVGSVSHGQQVDDIRAEMDQRDYRAALQTISRRLPDARSDPQARYDLLMLRGESLLQLKQKSAALDAFRSAHAAVRRGGDRNQSLAARGMIELLGTGSGWTYKDADGAVYDLIDPTTRKQAAAGMLAERLLSLSPKIDRAAAADALGPIIDLMPAIGAAMGLEYQATADVAKLTPIVQSLGERARSLITQELNRIANRTAELEDASNDFIVLDRDPVLGRRGLHSDETQELQAMLPYLDRIEQTAAEGRRINRNLGGSGESWDEILLRTSETESRVRGVLAINAPLTGDR